MAAIDLPVPGSDFNTWGEKLNIAVTAVNAQGDPATVATTVATDIATPDSAIETALSAKIVDALAADPTVTAAASAAVDDAIYDTRPSRNLYNPAAPDNQPGYSLNLAGGRDTVASAIYTTTGYIPVVAGQQYTISNPRLGAFYNASKAFVTGSDINNATNATVTVTAPAGSAFLRTTFVTASYGSTFQVENGAGATAYEPYGTVEDVDPIFAQAVGTAIGTLEATLTGTNLTIQADHNGAALAITGQMDGNNNKVFNLWGATLGGVSVHSSNDEATPVRTQHDTIGANHGFSNLYAWAAANHDKTTADLGSVWTDGLRQFALLAIDPSGNAIFGGDYTTDGLGVDNMATTALTANLTHVSGATNTAPLNYTQRLAAKTVQLYPAVQRIRQAVFVDGKPLATGAASGQSVEVRESYEILHYGSLYDLAKANIGTPYTTLNVPGAVRVETVHTFGGGGVASVDVNLTEIRPTRLSQTGIVQSNALYAPATRYLPGVKTIGGFNWSTGVDLSTYAVSQLVTTGDLWNATAPPVMSIDVRADIAFALGIHPWKPGVTKAAARITEAPTNLWDLRSTDKSYPTVIAGEPAGWGRYEGHAVRAYLTPAQAALVVGGADALGAWAALETVVQLP